MDVDVDGARVAGDVEDEHRVAVGGHDIGIGAAHRGEQQLVAHRAAIDGQMHARRGAAVEGRQPGEAGDVDAFAGRIEPQRILGEVAPERAAEPAQAALVANGLGRPVEGRDMLTLERKPDRRMGDGEASQHLRDRLRFGPVALEEFQPGRREGEEIADLDAGAGCRRDGADHALLAGLDDEADALGGIVAAGGDGEPRDRADRGQSLAAEAERADREEVAIGQFRGGVALDGERQILGRHARSVIDDADEFAPAGGDGHRDGAGAGVDGVLDQFLHRRSRPLDHLASGDAVDQNGIETADGHAGSGAAGSAANRAEPDG